MAATTLAVSRRSFVKSLAAMALAPTIGPRPASSKTTDRATEVDWLAEVQKPPAKLPADAPRLAPLLLDDEGQPITTRDAWERKRATPQTRVARFSWPHRPSAQSKADGRAGRPIR